MFFASEELQLGLAGQQPSQLFIPVNLKEPKNDSTNSRENWFGS